jgi:glycosyltransferase involved in cell wall biosynthesis
MTTTPTVSIVTPAFNSSAFIAETITAALAQTFSDFEFIVVDDGSTDDTIEVVHAAAAGDPRVIVIASPHGGPAVARNAGLDIARGRFIALLDSDDVWMPQYLDEQLALLERFPDQAIVTANAINHGGALDQRPLWPATRGWRELTLRDLILEENAVCIMSVFRRDVVDRIGGFARAFTGNEDYEFWIRAANAGFGILQNLRPLGSYRRRADSVSADSLRVIRGMMAVLGAVVSMKGPIEQEHEVIERRLSRLREELIMMQLRSSLSRQDGRSAALGLKALAEIRQSYSLAFAARVLEMCPQLMLRVYDLRRSLRLG